MFADSRACGMVVHEDLKDGADPVRSLGRLEERCLLIQELHIRVLDDEYPEAALREILARISDWCRPDELFCFFLRGQLCPGLCGVADLSSSALMRSDLRRWINDVCRGDTHVDLFGTRFEGVVGNPWRLKLLLVAGVISSQRWLFGGLEL